MYQEFTDKIQALEAEISQTETRLQTNILDVDRQKATLERLEKEFLQARKAYALDNSLDNQKAVDDLQKRVMAIKEGLDFLQILNEALEDKKTTLESDLKGTTDALKQAETERMASKAQALVIIYDKAVRDAYKASLYLRTMREEIDRRRQLNILKAACPAAEDLRYLQMIFNTTKIDPVNPCPLGPFATNSVQIVDEQYNPEQIINELIS